MQTDWDSAGTEGPDGENSANASERDSDQWQETGITFRLAEKADLDNLVRLHRELFELLRELRPVYYRRGQRSAHRARKYFLNALSCPEWGVYLAEDAGHRAVGFLVLFLYHRPGLVGGGVEAHIDDIYVVPTYRQQGVGEALLEMATIWAKAMGAERLTLWVESNNETAQAFYRHRGFREYEKLMALELNGEIGKRTA